MNQESIERIEAPLFTGDEAILPNATVRDFWAWAPGDLRLNANRGMLAQFLVAQFVGDPRPRDDGWGDFDVLTPGGVRVEVKSSGYLQSWRQAKLSRIVFSGLKARAWSAEEGYGAEPTFRADVFVFAVHTCQEPAAYDPLDLAAWDFYVLPAHAIRTLDQNSLALSRLRAVAPPPVVWLELPDAISAAARDQ